MNPPTGNNAVQAPVTRVIIVAAGSSVRFGGPTPKQYQPILGKPALYWAIKACLGLVPPDCVHVVIHPDHADFYAAARQHIDAPLAPPIIGANTRQASVHNAVRHLAAVGAPNDKVLVHDAARIAIHPDDIAAVIGGLDGHSAVTLAAPVTETLREKSGNQCGAIVDRDSLVSLQTPQGFRLGQLLDAHEKAAAQDQSYTDDTALMAAIGIDTTYILARHANLKITTPEDAMTAQHIISSRLPSRLIKTGMGFDVHAFGETSTHLRIGGIDIPHTHKLLGHSDADVALHAITDALYGVLADGDIGSHFPPSKAEHKNQDSSEFLVAARNQLKDTGGQINHVDTTIICEAPKIGPYREAIRKRIAEILEIPLSRVSVKATTTEQLGFTGRKEGIAAQAVVTAELPEHETE